MNYSIIEWLGDYARVLALTTDDAGQYITSDYNCQVFKLPVAHADALCAMSTTPALAVQFGSYARAARNFMLEAQAALSALDEGFTNALEYGGVGVYQQGICFICLGKPRCRPVYNKILFELMDKPEYALLRPLRGKLEIETEAEFFTLCLRWISGCADNVERLFAESQILHINLELESIEDPFE